MDCLYTAVYTLAVDSVCLYSSHLCTRFTNRRTLKHHLAGNQSYVAQKFLSAPQHPIIFIALVSSHQILKNESYYTYIWLVLSHYRLKNGIYYTHYLLIIWMT